MLWCCTMEVCCLGHTIPQTFLFLPYCWILFFLSLGQSFAQGQINLLQLLLLTLFFCFLVPFDSCNIAFWSTCSLVSFFLTVAAITLKISASKHGQLTQICFTLKIVLVTCTCLVHCIMLCHIWHFFQSNNSLIVLSRELLWNVGSSLAVFLLVSRIDDVILLCRMSILKNHISGFSIVDISYFVDTWMYAVPSLNPWSLNCRWT